ncbi:hypothetical protein F8388_014455 [Cannabis sativa]|uniref:SHSP domain-containing protein n=1 Tax=Cannabis sativa TaxID=3483 RepID=A0A7J6F7U0_CANSA|nr:hypothetical protein G4B88_012875 [Cannabis sativa]KAF4375733.1 hypothetical protein F8388_014455 [Cannabis sativa]
MDFTNNNNIRLISQPLFSILENILEFPENSDHHSSAAVTGPGAGASAGKFQNNNPTRAYVRDVKAMAATPADVIEYADAYAIVVDMPGIKPSQIKVQVEDDGVLVVAGERWRPEDENGGGGDGVKYLRMERRVGKFMRKFCLPENSDKDRVSAAYNDGILTVTVRKIPPPVTKRPKIIEVKGA